MHANADRRFSVSFQGPDDVSLHGNQLYLICSDGYEKAFESNAGFEQSAIDFAKLVSSGKVERLSSRKWSRGFESIQATQAMTCLLGFCSANRQLAESAVPEKAVDILELGNLSAATDAAFKEDYVANDDKLAKFERFNPPETNDKP